MSRPPTSDGPDPPTVPDPARRAAQHHVERLRAQERAEDGAEEPETVDDGTAQPDLSEGELARRRMADRGAWADELVRQAMARGEFDDLAYAGKPIPGIAGPHDPDWWVKGLVEREQITGVLPEALQLRKDAAALDDRLDRAHDAAEVRAVVEELNARVVSARRQLLGGPPVVTPTRDVEAEVARWSDRRRARAAEATSREQAVAEGAAATEAARRAAAGRRGGRRWWGRAR